MDMLSPVELVSQIKAGNRNAENLLIKQYWRSLHFILTKRSGEPELAKDITQEALLIVLAKVRDGQLDSPHALPSYVRQVGVNLLISHYRKEQRRKTTSTDQIDKAFLDHRSEIDTGVAQEKLVKIVQQVIQELPIERDRELLRCYFIYSHEKVQICNSLELTEAHFDRVLYRARNRLKQMLQVQLGIDDKTFGFGHLLSWLPIALLVTSLLEDKNFSLTVREYAHINHNRVNTSMINKFHASHSGPQWFVEGTF